MKVNYKFYLFIQFIQAFLKFYVVIYLKKL